MIVIADRRQVSQMGRLQAPDRLHHFARGAALHFVFQAFLAQLIGLGRVLHLLLGRADLLTAALDGVAGFLHAGRELATQILISQMNLIELALSQLLTLV